jgi:hypothetical protein
MSVNRDQAILEIQNTLGVVAHYEREQFLDHLLSQFKDPEGWLANVDYDYFPTILRKHYHKMYKYDKRANKSNF